jgi:hypothetical protein
MLPMNTFIKHLKHWSRPVLGVGLVLPNASKAYYRVVAVDRDGKRSRDSDSVAAPRPFIYKPGWMSIDPDTGLITGTPDGTGGPVTVSVTLTTEHRLVHDKDNIVWGNEYEQSRTWILDVIVGGSHQRIAAPLVCWAISACRSFGSFRIPSDGGAG